MKKYFIIIIILSLFAGGIFQLCASYIFGRIGFGPIELIECQKCGRVIEKRFGKVYIWQILSIPTHRVIKAGETDCRHEWNYIGGGYPLFSSIPRVGTFFVIASWVFISLGFGSGIGLLVQHIRQRMGHQP
jgi:hypothetical protein